MLPSERGVSGVCVKLTMPAFILTLQCGVSGPNKGGHKKADVERKRGGRKRAATACPICVRLTYSLRACVP